MSTDPDKKSYFYLPLEDCYERISECLDRNKVVESFIREYSKEQEVWTSGLMIILCEYYSINCRYVELINDIILTPPTINELTEQEEVVVDSQKYAILNSYSKLLIVDELELKYMHRVHLFIH